MRLSIEEVGLRYGKVDVLTGFSARFEDHTLTALTGPSGSGKTTLLAAMAGYLQPSSGTIRLYSDEGQPSPPTPALVAWVPQGSNALSGRTALDNVLLGALSSGRTMTDAVAVATAALERVGVAHRAGAAAKTLSGGELQRVAFARALASDKPIIFADEPTANLDADSTDQLAHVLEALRSTRLLVVATHDPILIEAAQTAVSLRPEHHGH